jgi:hypothetical protein
MVFATSIACHGACATCKPPSAFVAVATRRPPRCGPENAEISLGRRRSCIKSADPQAHPHQDEVPYDRLADRGPRARRKQQQITGEKGCDDEAGLRKDGREQQGVERRSVRVRDLREVLSRCRTESMSVPMRLRVAAVGLSRAGVRQDTRSSLGGDHRMEQASRGVNRLRPHVRRACCAFARRRNTPRGRGRATQPDGTSSRPVART